MGGPCPEGTRTNETIHTPTKRSRLKGKGPKIEPDTVINFNEVEPHASIWTASEPVFRNLLKLGYKPTVFFRIYTAVDQVK